MNFFVLKFTKNRIKNLCTSEVVTKVKLNFVFFRAKFSFTEETYIILET